MINPRNVHLIRLSNKSHTPHIPPMTTYEHYSNIGMNHKPQPPSTQNGNELFIQHEFSFINYNKNSKVDSDFPCALMA
jgi:hypothetical protein